MLELLAVRRMLEPEVTALAAAHVDSELEKTLPDDANGAGAPLNRAG
jgi:hypothetical protein